MLSFVPIAKGPDSEETIQRMACIRRIADLLLKARHALALTGAGVSTASGLPDYRSPGSGLWETMDPLKVASAQSFCADPEAFYAALRPMADRLLRAEPNAAHLALADLEQQGLLAGIITQNVDGLHQRAGSQRVWELHGHLGGGHCLLCGRPSWREDHLARYVAEGEIPRCPECGGVLKPQVVLFGDPLPRWVFLEATGHIERCDLLLVVGSSLEVAPASDLPLWAMRRGVPVVIINETPTYLDEKAEVVVHGRAEEVLPCVVAACHTRRTFDEGMEDAERKGSLPISLRDFLARFGRAIFLRTQLCAKPWPVVQRAQHAAHKMWATLWATMPRHRQPNGHLEEEANG